jgi:GNAT superfamily N-acetyltransferase
MTAPVTLRQARPGDMLGCARVFVQSSTDLGRRQGSVLPPADPLAMAAALGHLQRTDPRGFHVAVRGRRVVAFASTILRGNTHFLSMFWALPQLQSQGVGRRLLARAFEHPRPPQPRCAACSPRSIRARRRSTSSSACCRAGCSTWCAASRGLSPRPRRTVELVQVGEVGKTTPEMLATAARFDRRFRASRRDADIRYVMSLPGRPVLPRARRSATVGYAVVTDKGRVGPAGVADSRYGAGLAWAITEAVRANGADTMTVIVPGVFGPALDVFFAAGLKTEFFGAWMSAKPLGELDTYLLAGGMLL